ncbi:MAG: TIGR00341 family protein, partial [Persicimonas sp.]
IDGVRLSWDYVVMVAMSAVVAAVGIYRDDLVLVIAGMIIAPLLYPNMALALATNLADKDLGWHALKVNALGLLAALAVAVLFGLVMPIESSFESTGLRTSIGSLDVVVAAAAGTAAALSFVSQKSGTVVGVMVAVALLPPLVSLGMLFGAGYWSMAVAPLLLFLINVICINLAAVITFVAWKVSPRTHHEEKRAHRAWRRAIALWVLLLGALVALALFAGEYWEPFW